MATYTCSPIDSASFKAALRKTAWAQRLTPIQMDRVEAECYEKIIPAGGYVIRKGDRILSWTGVVEGLVKMNNLSPEGRSVTFTGIADGGWFGEGSILKKEARKYDIIALRDSRIGYMPGPTFDWLMDTSLPFTRFLLEQLNERLGHFIATVEFDRLSDINTRVARCLAAIFNPHLSPGAPLHLKISQEEIGYLSGISRQRTNLALQVLEKEGLLMTEYNSIRITDLEGLRNFRRG